MVDDWTSATAEAQRSDELNPYRLAEGDCASPTRVRQPTQLAKSADGEVGYFP